MKAINVIRATKKQTNQTRAKLAQRYFKTGKGQYGEGDIFWGLTVPQARIIVKKFNKLPLQENQILLKSKIHELRLIGLLILVEQFKKADLKNKEIIVKFYLANLKNINNWDLVDLTAHKILGEWLINRPTKKLYQLAQSKNLWERRIAIIATFAHLRNNNLKHSLALAKKLLNDKHDLMHKAVGWVLREVGGKSLKDLMAFLDEHGRTMPRTMLRYAIEKLPENKRQYYLKTTK